MSSQPNHDTSLHLVLEVANHDALLELLDVINTADVQARTENISQAGVAPDASVTIDLGILTTKQRETLELALESGYYERPRTVDLTYLAEELGVSKSAVSQRLRTAETKLIRGAFGHHN